MRFKRHILRFVMFCSFMYNEGTMSFLSAGGVLILRPWAQSRDCEIRRAWKRRGWHWHRCDLRDWCFFLCCGFDSLSALYDLNGWPPSVLLPALPLLFPSFLPSHPITICFVAWPIMALFLLHINPVIIQSIKLMKWSCFGGFNYGCFGDYYPDCTCVLFHWS